MYPSHDVTFISALLPHVKSQTYSYIILEEFVHENQITGLSSEALVCQRLTL